MIHQHDGIVILYESFWNATFGRYTGSSKIAQVHNASMYANVFLPNEFQRVLGDKDRIDVDIALKELQMLISGIRQMYFTDFQCWSDEQEFKTHVCNNIFYIIVLIFYSRCTSLMDYLVRQSGNQCDFKHVKA